MISRLFCMGIVASILLFHAGIRTAGAQESSSQALASANKLTEILSEEMVSPMSQAMTKEMWPQISKPFQGKIDAATDIEMRSEFNRILTKFVSQGLRDAPATYADYFDAKEIRKIIAFYQISTVRLSPTINAELFGSATPSMSDFQSELRFAFENILRKNGYKK